MARVARFALLALLAGCAAAPKSQPADDAGLTIRLAQEDGPSRATHAQLLRLLAAHDTARWTWTREIVIDSAPRVIPHSHPVLTLSVRHLRDDDLLLATYLHEQLHWFVSQREDAVEAAIDDLRAAFPGLPVGHPDGARDEYSGYLHLIVCYLEWRAAIDVMGELRARQVMAFWSHDHYRRIYRLVLEHPREIRAVLQRHALLP